VFDTNHEVSIGIAHNGATIRLNQIGMECLPNGDANERSLSTGDASFNTPEECYAACDAAARSLGQQCNEFIFGTGWAFGSCWWEYGPCTEYATGMPYDLYSVIEDPANYTNPMSGSTFTMRQANTECLPNDAGMEHDLGTFNTLVECFYACE
jgi:hypothetical protein